MEFKLGESFLSQYKNKTPEWGGLGEFTFLRTYSRFVEDENRKEKWWETVRRVVEGTYNIQKEHCNNLQLEWNNIKSHRSAEKMYDKIFSMKFLPPGRGLWLMGSNFIKEKKSSAALNNCAYISSEDIDIRGSFMFTWTMDALMLGVGCIAKGEKILTLDGVKKIEDIQHRPSIMMVNGKPYFSRTGSWKTGEKDTYSLQTKEGYELKLTDNHKVLTEKKEWKEVKNLKLNEKIVLHNHRDNIIKWGGFGSFDEGYLVGLYWSDGYSSREPLVCVYDKDNGHQGIKNAALKSLENIRISNKYKMRKDHKGFRRREKRQVQELSIGKWVYDILPRKNKHSIQDNIEQGSFDFYQGFLRGAFDGDGSVLDGKNNNRTITLTQANYKELQTIQRMLLKFGIYSTISVKRDRSSETTICNKKTIQNECWILKITKDSIPIFYEKINFSNSNKKETLEKIVKQNSFYNTNFYASVKSINFIGKQDVYDINVDEISAFDANGFYVHNCGFDTKGANKITVKKPKDDGIYQIPDSREGWVESLCLLLDSFFKGKGLPVFDYSLIRPYGSPIKGFGGVASGHAPLKKMHDSIYNLLINKTDKKLTSVDIVDIINMISVCVVAGNVRRSACLALGEHTDIEYVTMKDYNKYPKELKERRWASNNSVFAEVGKTDYSSFIDSITLNGEPGIIWLENIKKYSRTCDMPDWKDIDAVGINPCGEQSLENAELCCLVETFPSKHDSFEEYKETLKYAYLYGKTVTLLSTHWPETNAVLLKNRRIGLSQSGIQDAFNKHGRRNILEWCDYGYKYIEELDKKYSNWLCVPQSKKKTSVKPSGSVSLLPGVSAGIHHPHSEYYIRRVRLSKDDKLVNIMKNAGYEIETSVNDESTAIVNFPIHEKYFSRRKEDVSVWQQVKDVADYQKWWADNNVSVTITFKKEEKDDIINVLESYEDSLKAISFLPLSDHGYTQAPYEQITKDQYEKMIKKIKKPEFSTLTNDATGSKFCDGESCEI